MSTSTGRPAEGVALTVDDDLVGAVDFAKGGGLVPAIVQDADDGTVLTVAYMDAEALRRTLSSGRSWFYSRSRGEYWQKGETSGDRQYVREVRVDCDGDALSSWWTSTGEVPVTRVSGRASTAPIGVRARRTESSGRADGRRPVLDFRPDPAEFAALAKEHAIVPVWCEVVADTLTPVACFANVVGEDDGFLLESVEGGERWGRYSFVGRRPLATLTARGRAVATARTARSARLRRRHPGRGRGPGDPVPLPVAPGPATAARRARRVPRLRRGARGRAPARILPPTTWDTPTPRWW